MPAGNFWSIFWLMKKRMSTGSKPSCMRSKKLDIRITSRSKFTKRAKLSN